MPPISPAIDILVLVSSLAAFLAIRNYRRRLGLPCPPGPRPLPLIGNLLDIPKEFSWLSYTELSKKHGDILSFHVFGKVIVVLNSVKASKDLFERRGDIYSDRPVIPIFEMTKWEWLVGFSMYTESLRSARKLLERSLRPTVIAAYRPLLQTKAHVLLTQMLANPDEFEAHLYHLTGSLILAMVYGYEVKEQNDQKVDAARKLLHLISEVTLPGALLVNHLPFLKHIPEWLPWLSYKPLARYGYDIGQEVLHEPMKFVRESILNGTAQPSLALDNLQETEKLEGPEREKAEEVIAKALGSMYLAGTETTASSVMSFLVAALLRPEIQTIAQGELDTVTRRERLPSLEDRPKLPFVDAICKEVTRWRPVTPLGLFHATTCDDVYKGFFIPKDAVVIMNVWAILHDPAVYPEPDLFKPERFIDPNGGLRDDPLLTSVFGYGKRICPGRHLADTTLFIVIASLLSVFNIKKNNGAVDGGPDIYPFTGHLTSAPCPFTCSIIPRDRKAEELIASDVQRV